MLFNKSSLASCEGNGIVITIQEYIMKVKIQHAKTVLIGNIPGNRKYLGMLIPVNFITRVLDIATRIELPDTR